MLTGPRTMNCMGEGKCAAQLSARTHGGGVKHVELFPLVPVAHFPLDDYAYGVAIESAQIPEMASTDLSICMSQVIRRGVERRCCSIQSEPARAHEQGMQWPVQRHLLSKLVFCSWACVTCTPSTSTCTI